MVAVGKRDHGTRGAAQGGGDPGHDLERDAVFREVARVLRPGGLFVANDGFAPNPSRGVHAFCHCFPGLWHQMSVILSAASCLTWVTRLTGAASESQLLAEVEAAGRGTGSLLFLPYLSGERTPHNDPDAKGVFFGLTHDHTRADLARAVLEGVAYAFADGQDVLGEAGTEIATVSVIGGGARSRLWGRILADVLGALS